MALLMDGALVGAVALLISAPLANAASLVALWPSV
jgi:hypothetical protein